MLDSVKMLSYWILVKKIVIEIVVNVLNIDYIL